MSGEQDNERGTPQAGRRRAALGYDARSERRALRGAARRRKTRTRFWLVAGPTVVVIALVVVLLALLGGNGAPVVTDTTSTTVVKGSSGEGGLLVVEQDGSALLLVAIQARRENGLVLTLPGITLLKTADGFATLADLHGSGRGEVLLGALDDELGIRVKTVASVAWSGLRGALLAAGVADVPGERLELAGGESEQMARSVLALMSKSGPESGSSTWSQLELRGDATQFRADLGSLASAPATGSWSAGALTGRLVEGEGFMYLEPATDRLALLLAGPTEGNAITVEIQNGAGTVGVVASATAELEALGYTLVSAGNSVDFPGAKETRIAVAVDAAEAGERVRLVLGVGAVAEDIMLDLGHVVVVLGRDYLPREPAAGGSAP